MFRLKSGATFEYQSLLTLRTLVYLWMDLSFLILSADACRQVRVNVKNYKSQLYFKSLEHKLAFLQVKKLYEVLASQEEILTLTEKQRDVVSIILDNNMVAIRGSGIYPITYSTLAEVSF